MIGEGAVAGLTHSTVVGACRTFVDLFMDQKAESSNQKWGQDLIPRGHHPEFIPPRRALNPKESCNLPKQHHQMAHKDSDAGTGAGVGVGVRFIKDSILWWM